MKELRFHPLSYYPEYMEADAFVDEQTAKVLSEMTMIEFQAIDLAELDSLKPTTFQSALRNKTSGHSVGQPAPLKQKQIRLDLSESIETVVGDVTCKYSLAKLIDRAGK